ncbi:hypothetical protein M5689_021040 [Euphorbia peplus]|nr:hypothetical protein M5689_021040 [Euphorbia peplus]
MPLPGEDVPKAFLVHVESFEFKVTNGLGWVVRDSLGFNKILEVTVSLSCQKITEWSKFFATNQTVQFQQDRSVIRVSKWKIDNSFKKDEARLGVS